LLQLAVALWALAAAPAHALRCDNQIISEGDRTFDVLRKCGQPDFVDHRFEGLAFAYPFAIEVEDWYYDLGPTQLVRMLRFRNDRLAIVRTGGYSFGEATYGGCRPEEIEPGLSKFDLLSRCGEPDYSDAWMEYRSKRVGEVFTYPVSVEVEEWIYSFGSNRFIRYVTLINGRVRDVETGERDD
jgi:hypothetical protein